MNVNKNIWVHKTILNKDFIFILYSLNKLLHEMKDCAANINNTLDLAMHVAHTSCMDPQSKTLLPQETLKR